MKTTTNIIQHKPYEEVYNGWIIEIRPLSNPLSRGFTLIIDACHYRIEGDSTFNGINANSTTQEIIAAAKKFIDNL